MRRYHSVLLLLTGSALAAGLLFQTRAARASSTETISAEASVTSADGVKVTKPVIMTIERFASETDRVDLVASIKRAGTAGARELLSKAADLGTVQVGERRTPIKFAFAKPSALGRVITIVTAEAIGFIGADLPGAKPTAGYDLGLVILQAVSGSPGHGELVPATKVRVDNAGSIVTDSYSGDVVSLSNVVER